MRGVLARGERVTISNGFMLMKVASASGEFVVPVPHSGYVYHANRSF